MAKLWILSDRHLKAVLYPDQFRSEPPAFDMLVAAGDMWKADPRQTFRVLHRLANDEPVVFVMGNHEHWHDIVPEALARAQILAGCRFVGTTLRSDCRLAGQLDPDTPTGEPIDVAHDGGHHLLTVGDAAALHRHARAELAALMDEGDGALPLIGVTHHAPHPDCIAPAWRGTWNAGSLTLDLSALTDTGRAALWMHGHVHHSLDLVRPGGTRILCNPAGPRFANPAFDAARAITIG